MRPAVRAIFLSDLHLGLTGCRADLALDFLRSTTSERLYLVGDILDLWVMRRRVRWDPVYNRLLRHLLKRAQRGERVTYLPGNHDAEIADLAGIGLVNIHVVRQVIHEALDGRRLLVTHGDEADTVVRVHPRLAYLGAHAYDWLVGVNHLNNRLRHLVGAKPWSLSRAVKAGVKRATTYIANFEEVLAMHARALGAEGVICGHIHHPVLRECYGVTYMNCGDWIEHCSAVVEHWTGRFEVVMWSAERGGAAEDELGKAGGLLRLTEYAADWKTSSPEELARLQDA
jgi:UDP-2,3-diacylglucosamine pyrophosphatase LpxH